MINKVKYWIEISDYDFDTAVAMLQSERYLYVGFMCHQSVEKALKAYYVKLRGDTPPFSHSLSYIAKKGGFYDHFSEIQKSFIDQIEPLNIETRYPSYKERLLFSLTEIKCKEIIQDTNLLLQWIKEKL
ncbi:MAG TPA: HEPN domain-containing protein [Prolixibacteraceae bacterium]|nr:HEPN domain-containing protein [Prolixibacteraceae bacterium]